MSVVASIDYTSRNIYLSAATMNVPFDTMDLYREVRALRRTTESHRRFKPIVIAGGNVEKIAGQTYTPSYVQLLYGARIVPYDASHRITLVRDTFTDDGFAGRDCFDRTSLTPGVEVGIDVQVDKIEIVRVATGGNEYTLTQISDATRNSIFAQAQLTPIHSDMRKAVGQTYHGDGSEGNKLRSTLVP